MAAKRVLLIEDDPSIGELLKTAIELEGYEVFWGRDGREGLRLADTIAPGLVLCDMMMPVLDGFGFLKEYMSRPAPVPVIAMSAMANYAAAARAAGAQLALRKPLELDELLRHIATIGGSPGVAPAQPLSASSPLSPALNPPDESLQEISEGIERRRIQQVLGLRLDQPAPEAALHGFVDYVARLFEVPVCLISVITAERQYWTAMCGIEGDLKSARGGPRHHSFCTHAVAAHTPLVVQDAATNPIFRDNPFVTERGFRFYAGVPLIIRSGEAVGTLCMLDYVPKVFTRLDLELMTVLSRRVLAELDWRAKRADPTEPDASFSYLSYLDAETNLVGREGFMDVLRIEACRQAQTGKRSIVAAVEVAPDEIAAITRELERVLGVAWIGRLSRDRLGVLFSSAEPAAALELLEKTLEGRTKVAATDATSFCGAVDVALGIVEDHLSDMSSKRLETVAA